MGIGSKLGWSAVRHLVAFALTGGAANVACAAWDFYDVYDTVTTVADISDATDVMSGGSDVRFGGDDGGLLHDTYTDKYYNSPDAYYLDKQEYAVPAPSKS